METTAPLATTAVLLAAGESTRMGQLKALIPWEGRTLFEYQVSQLLSAPVERLVVVLGYRHEDLLPRLPDDPRIVTVHNPAYATGKVSSILAGVQASPPEAHVLILGVDQPRPEALLSEVVRAHASGVAPVSIAAYGGRRGHPVVFSPAVRTELLAISEETEGLRSVLRARADGVARVETGDPLALVNLNTPEDYQRALALSSTSSARAGNQ